MRETASNHELLDAWRTGDELAARVLFDRYLARLTALARSRLSQKLARRLDPEDIVLSAWRSFFVAAANGRVDIPEDDNLWPLLVTITIRKLSRQTARQQADRRSVDCEVSSEQLQTVIANDPTPEQAAILTEELDVLLGALDESNRDILIRRLKGETQQEIAQACGCSERTVRRTMQHVRNLMEKREQANGGPRNPVLQASSSHQTKPASRPPKTRISIDGDVSDADLIIHEMVGQGGFGRVYRATWKADGRPVAVKFLKKRFWGDRRALQGLMNEVDAAQWIQHPHIRPVRNAGRTRRGVPFLVMEWIEGEDLATWVARAQPTVDDILQSTIPITAAITSAHAAGVLHCDLKPTNVIRRHDGHVFLTDFGFARGRESPNPSFAGGTVGFLAPEQISPAFGDIGPHTDVYGLGALLYGLLTGQPPFAGRDVAETLANVLSSKPPHPLTTLNPTVPVELDRLCATCLEKEPTRRVMSADELAASLRSIG